MINKSTQEIMVQIKKSQIQKYSQLNLPKNIDETHKIYQALIL
jgi:hypothetical protein